MASLVNRPNGRREIQFTDWNDRRKTLRLGKLSKRDAETVKSRVEDLISAKIAKLSIPVETVKWINGLDDSFRDKLVAVGLVEGRDSALLGSFLESFIDDRTDVKLATRKKYISTKNKLLEYFSENRELRSIREAEADDWRKWLSKSGSRPGKVKEGKERPSKPMAENTIRKHISVAKVFFGKAVRRRLIETNPFADQVAAIQENPDREYFVTRKEAEAVLEACPDNQWRLLFAFARFGGMRVPSEPLSITWGDVDWERQRIRIPSPKTENQGKASRVIPIFPEIRPHLEEAWEKAEEGSDFVISRYRESEGNLRTQLARIIRKAGLEPWSKLWQNLRSSRETELVETYPLHVVCDWIGNSKRVAMKHYLQTHEAHFEKATQSDVSDAGENLDPPGNHGEKRGPQPDVKSDADSEGKSWTLEDEISKTLEISRSVLPCRTLSIGSVAGAGLEQPVKVSGKTEVSQHPDVKSDATSVETLLRIAEILRNSLSDSDLEILVDNLQAKQEG